MALPARSARERIIIAFDVDNFYVASERLRDPSLVGRPVGITQKTILATCSYEARDMGVKKLSLIGDAKRLCPDIVLRSGEDLTQYRKHSRQIWRLVTGIVGSQPEKLGMDELFVDVTALVDAHLLNHVDRSNSYFRLSKPGEVERGFEYGEGLAGMPYGSGLDIKENARFVLASHLAAFIRSTIALELGFTTSAGVAHNKLLAKLLASENKPAKQTTWLPPPPSDARQQAVLDYLAPLPVTKLNGFGHRYNMLLRTKLLGDPERKGNGWMDAHPNMQLDDDGDYFSDLAQAVDAPEPLSVEQVRQGATAKQMQDWFGERLGQRLWSLLHGIDDEPVLPTPEYPKQISVEDSYLRAKTPTVSLALAKINALAASLLARLELELVDEPASLLSGPSTSTTASVRTWARHPTQIRLSLRGGPGAGSKTAPMPLDTLDLAGPPRDIRAEALAQAFAALFRKMIGPAVAASKERVSLHVINLAVVGFEANAPTPSVRTLLRKRPAADDLDGARPTLQAVWLDDDDDAGDETGLDRLEEGHGSAEEGHRRCETCHAYIPSFALPAHTAWHLEPG